MRTLMVSGILFFINGLCFGQLHSEFKATPTEGCAPLVVTFSDLSTGNPGSWSWDLGNGTKSILQNPAGTYFTPGTYTVKLVVRNSLGRDSITKTNYITVRASPEVKFSGSRLRGCFPLTTQFTDASEPGNGTITKWEWDFGDGNASSEQNPVHTYTIGGNFNVSLRVTNSFGCVTSQTFNSYVQIGTGTDAQFTNSNPNSCDNPVTINFINQSTGTGTLSYQWSFGDGGNSSQPSPSHTYTVKGNYDVQLIVSNSVGCSDTLKKPNLISIGNTEANFEIPSTVCQNSFVNFKNTSTPSPGSALWDFGDGTLSTSINPSKEFTTAGEFDVKMVVNFGACKDSVTKKITVIPAPVVGFAASATAGCKVPLDINFTNTSDAGNTYSWNFGDGVTSDAINPSHTYLVEGDYEVTLLVTNSSGCTTQLVKPKYIILKKPVVSIDNLPANGCVPLTHTFSSTVKTTDQIVNYQWNFGDGNFSSEPNPTHVYTIPGKYDITLTYTTDGGCVDSVKYISGILAGSKPKANFSATPLNTCAETRIEFTNLSTGGANEFYWSFGDGGSSAFSDPSYRYYDTGYFPVTLIAINNGCGDTLRIPDYIHIKPPVARFSTSQNCNAS
ncbi:MAG: PKD domain-containing protein, partial [Ginsengibacter sp.]